MDEVTGILWEPEDQKDLASKILHWLQPEQRATAHSIAASGKELARTKYSREQGLKGWTDLINSLF
jgi:hypothetical protein